MLSVIEEPALTVTLEEPGKIVNCNGPVDQRFVLVKNDSEEPLKLPADEE